MPTLCPGDLIIFKPTKSISLIKKGCLVVFNHPLKANLLLVKRVHKINKSGLELRGDRKSQSSDSRQFGLVAINQVQGIVESLVSKEQRIPKFFLIKKFGQKFFEAKRSQ